MGGTLMTKTILVAKRPNGFRGVVEQIDRHEIRIAHEFRGVETVAVRPDLKLRKGHIVRRLTSDAAQSGSEWRASELRELGSLPTASVFLNV
jgi:hypothetical protein